MTRTAFCRKSPRVPRESLGLEVGPWEPATEEGEEGKIKRTGVRKFADLQRSRNLCLHIVFLEYATTGAQTTFSLGRLAPFKLSEQFQYVSRWRSRLRFKVPAFYFDLVRLVAILCDRPPPLLREPQAMRIVSSWRKIKATIFMCGLDALVAAGPGSIRAAISGPSRS